MDIREQKISQFNWNWKSKGTGRSDADLTISIKKDGKLNFVFRNGTDGMISSTGNFVCAVCKNRMLFMEANRFDGYAMSKSKNDQCENKYASMNLEEGKSFVGNHELLYDEFLELYYIEGGN